MEPAADGSALQIATIDAVVNSGLVAALTGSSGWVEPDDGGQINAAHHEPAAEPNSGETRGAMVTCHSSASL